MARPGILIKIAFALLIGALSVIASSENGCPWKARVEYKYELNARSLAGLPSLQGQYSGVRYGGEVRVQGLTVDTVLIRMEKLWWSPLHARMQSGWWSVQPQHNHTFPGNDDAQQELRLSGASAVLRFKDGEVKSILVSKSAADWEVNLLQGVVGQIQVQMNPKSGNSLHSSGHHQTDKDVFRVMESSVSGRCEVIYEITTSNPPAQKSSAESKICDGKTYIQITKTRNFTACEQFTEETRGLPKCTHPGNSCGSLWTRNSVSQLIGCGSEENFQLVQSVTSGSVRAMLQLRDGSQAAEVNSFNLTLSHVAPVRERLPTPKDGILLVGLGYRVNGKQVSTNSDDYENEDDNGSDSVEVISHKKKFKNNSESESKSDSSSNESSQKHHHKHKKNGSNSSDQSGSSNESGKLKKKSHKHNGSSSSEESGSRESNESGSRNESGKLKKKSHKHNGSSSSEESGSRDSSESGSRNESGKLKSRKNFRSRDSDESVRNESGQHKKNSGKKHGHNNSNDSQESSTYRKGNRYRQSNRMAREAHGDRMAREAHGDRMVREAHGDRMAREAHGDRMAREAHGDRMAREAHGDRMVREAHGDRMAREAHGDRMVREAHGDRMVREAYGNRMVREAYGNRMVREAYGNRMVREAHGDNADFHSDLLAGALSPYSVQGNSSLLSHVQHRLVDLIQDAAKEIVRPEGPNSQTMERLGMAVRLARALTSQQLRKIRDQLKDNDDQWQLFRDVVAATGSEAGVRIIMEWIRERKVSSFTAQQMLSNLPLRVSKPTASILKQVQAVYTGLNGEEDESIQIAAAIALGELASRSQSKEAVSFLSEQIKWHGAKATLRAALACALGATANPRAIEPLIEMAKNAKLPAYLRAQAVIALMDNALRNPARVGDSLLALYHSPQNPAPVRLAAVSVLVYLRPSLTVWQRLAVSTWYETNPTVSTYVWSTIFSFAHVKDPVYTQASKMARLVLPLTRPSPQGLHLAFNKVAASVDAKLERLAHEHMSYFTPVEGANVYYRRVMRSGGESSVDSEMDIWAANPDAILQSTLKSAFGWKDNRLSNRPPQKNVPHSTRSIHEGLNIIARHLPDPQGHLRLTVMPFLRKAYIPFGKDTPSYIAKAAAKLMDEARSGKSFKLQQMGGQELSVTTISEMGFPICLRLQAPWVLRATGKVYLHRNDSAQANINFLYASGLTAQLGVQPSWANREYVAGVKAHAMLSPSAVTLRAQANATEGRWWLSGEAHQGVQGEGAARIVAQPYTASLELTQAELPSQTTAIQNATNARAASQHMLLTNWDSLSVMMHAPVKMAALPSWLKESQPVLGFPLLGPALTASRLDVMLARPDPFNVSFSLVKAMTQNGDLHVVYPENLKWNETSDGAGVLPGSDTTTTTTENPSNMEASTTTENSAVTTTSTFLNYNIAPANTVTVPSRAMRSAQHSNGSWYVDSGDVDLSVEALNASTVNPFVNHINGSSELFLLSQTLAGMNGGRAYVIGVNMTSEPQSSYSAFWTFGSSLASKLTRVGLFARNNQHDSQLAASAALYADVPSAMTVTNALGADREVMIKADFVKTDSSSAKAVVTAFVDSSRSVPMKRRLWLLAQEQGCTRPSSGASATPACRAILNNANTPDQYNVTVNYNDVALKKFEYTANLAWQSVKAHLWNEGNIAVNSADNGVANEISIGMTAQTDGTVDGWMKTPHTFTEVVGAAPPSALRLAKYAAPRKASCGVTSRNLYTLDGVEANIELSECWHLLAKDCSGKSRVAVLARSKPGDSSALQVEVNIDNYQIAQMNPEGTLLNGIPVSDLQPAQIGSAVEARDAADVGVMRITRARDGAQVVDLPDHGVSVVYGNSSVIVQAGVSLRGRLCGMCGNFDGSQYGEWHNPQDKLEKSAQAFTNSYKIDCGKSRH